MIKLFWDCSAVELSENVFYKDDTTDNLNVIEKHVTNNNRKILNKNCNCDECGKIFLKGSSFTAHVGQ